MISGLRDYSPLFTGYSQKEWSQWLFVQVAAVFNRHAVLDSVNGMAVGSRLGSIYGRLLVWFFFSLRGFK